MEDDLSDWERVLKTLQNLAQWATTREKMEKEEIPDLLAQIRDHEAKLPGASRSLKEVGSIIFGTVHMLTHVLGSRPPGSGRGSTQ